MDTLPRLTRARASDSVADMLRASILGSTFRPGQRLDVKSLADQLGVSPTPVKDAINRLAAEGLIDIRPRSGTFVTDITPKMVEEIFEIRRALECLAAELTMARMTPALLRTFTSLTRQLETPVTNEQERMDHERANVALHMQFIESSGNQQLLEMYRSLNAHLTIARIHSRQRPDAKRLEAELHEHGALLEAMQAGDAKRLVQVLGDHISRAGKDLVEDVTLAQSVDPA
ncbi:GntR family transcriptional regulator [Stenotrophomonas tumulicola]|uniref:GntR family transcriptional regulator n=1 Tax=Stenotrophomonas tumulicola TaxID=1685415 RepID=A0A7W3FKY7_9GAMM|nr:GntR family transcriptional regulator [Stenotrophomonas tumulicola]MBA8681418.1 GntR family transcriptional regulator [Stenotrophomonas tumulicola]